MPDPTLPSMQVKQSPEAIDPRLVLRVFAWIATGAGLGVYAWPAALVPWGSVSVLPEGPWVLTRVVAAAVAASGVCAAVLATIADPFSRGRALYAFASAHLVFGLLFFLQWMAILDRVVPPAVGLTPLAAGIALFYVALTHDSDTGGPSLDALRTQYQERIEEAARQEERTRLARDLHDAVKQQLFVIQTSSAAIEARFPHDQAGAFAALAQVRTAAREASTEMETLIDQLQTAPLETTGLRDALKRQCEALAVRTGADVQLTVGDLPPDMWLPPGALRTLFRCAQEALANAGRHARARNVSVRLGTQGAQLELAVEDDGAGFDIDSPRAGMGIENMRARARALGGTFVLTSTPRAGTAARFIIPLRHRTLQYYGFQALLWAALLTLSTVLWTPARALQGVVSAVAVIALVRYVVAIVRLHRAGARWR